MSSISFLKRGLAGVVSFTLACALVPLGYAHAEDVQGEYSEPEAAEVSEMPDDGEAALSQKADSQDVPVPGADAPVSPSTSATHINASAEDFVSEEALEQARAKLRNRSAWDYSNATFADILAYAEQYIGLEYVWGGKDLYRDGGFDCSGFVNWVYNHVAGTNINSDWTNAADIYAKYCTPISESEARPGDIVFFKGTYGSDLGYISHVGIYCGGGVTLNAGDPIGYDRVSDFANVKGQQAQRVYGRLVTLKDSSVVADLSKAKVHVADQPYTGAAIEPAPVVTLAGSVLTEGEDYTVSYENNIAKGAASVVVQGAGSYSGTNRASFDIYAPALKDGSFVVSSALGNAKVLDIRGGSVSAGAFLQIYGANETDAQAFKAEFQNDGSCLLRNVKSGLVLTADVSAVNLYKGVPVTQEIDAALPGQRWHVKQHAAGDFEVASALDASYVLDVKNGLNADGMQVQLWESNDTAAQRWAFSEFITKREKLDALAADNAAALVDGKYLVNTALSQKSVLDARGGGIVNGTIAQIYQANGTDAQVWEVSHDAVGYVVLKNGKSGLALDVSNGNASQGAKVHLWQSNNTYAQKWIAVPDGESFKFVSALDDSFVLDLTAASTSNGNNVQLYTSNNTRAQRWFFSKTQTFRDRMDGLAAANAGVLRADKVYAVRSAVNPGFVLDAYGGNTANGTAIQAWEGNGTGAQQWRVSLDETGYVTLTNVKSGRVLDVAAARAVSGTPVQLYDNNNTYAQKWIAIKDGQGIKLVSALSDSLVLDLSNASAKNGSKIQIYASNDTVAQRWTFVDAGCERVIPAASYVVSSSLNRDFVLDVANGSNADGANIQLYEKNSTPAQTFAISYSYGYYVIKNVKSGKMLSVSSDGDVRQQSGIVDDAKRWIAYSNPDGTYAFMNLATGFALGASSGAVSNGVNVVASAFDKLAGASSAQRWILEKPAVQGGSQYPFPLSHIAMLNTSSALSYGAAYEALNPAKCTPSDDDYLQFADIRGYMGTVTASQINDMISRTQGSNGVFAGKGQQILNAAKAANINEMYFFAHMMTETAWGKSVQAQGRYFGEGNATVKLDGVYYTKKAPAGTYYNFIGWGAYDNDPDTAFDFARYYGWNTVEFALNGAAEKLATFYVYAGQETLYEMRWDPDYTARPGCLNVRSSHQYCTSTTWTDTIAQIMGYNYRNFVGGTMPVSYIIPQYAG